MNPPTSANVRSWSRVEFDAMGYEEDAPDPLDVLVGRAVEYVEDVTGREIDATMPTNLEHTANEAVQRRVEQLAFQSQDEHVDTAADEVIARMGAGSYNETKRAPADLSVEKTRMVNPWRHLHDLLWRLMTEAKREWWLEQFGKVTPAFEVSEVAWWPEGLVDDPYVWGA